MDNLNNIFTNRDGLEIPYTKVLFDSKSKFQRVRIFQTAKLGKIIVLDDIMFQAEDGDELTEMATHLPLNVGPLKKNIAAIGAGDGFALKELVKHQYLKSIDIVEIDETLNSACKEIFPFNDVWNDKRVKTVIMDGLEYIKTAKNKDIIISTPANTWGSDGEQNIAFPLFTPDFFRDVFQALSDDGIFVTDGSTAHYAEKEPNWVSIYRDLKKVFPIVFPYFFASKRMPGGSFVLVYASKKYDPMKDFNEKIVDLQTRYYNKGIHFASFSLPQFLLKKLP